MQRLNWIIAAAAALAPAIALAEEPATEARPAEPRHILAIESPARFMLLADDAAANIELVEQEERAGRPPAAMEKGAYLGISASPPPRVLRKQLGLPPGTGLVIDFVVPASPASQAGLLQYDVLAKLDDQLIVNPQQLAVLVRSHKPGDEIKLGILRDGKAQTITVKLVEHDLEPLPEEEEGDEGMQRLRHFLPEPRIVPAPHGMPGHSAHAPGSSAASLTWIESGRSYTITTDNQGRKTFTSRDRDGKVLFEGPINTKEEREKLPADQKQKLEWIEQHMHIQPSASAPATQPSGD